MVQTRKTNRVMPGGSSMQVPANHMIESSGVYSSLSNPEHNKRTHDIFISQLVQLSKTQLISLLLNKQTSILAIRTKRRDWTKKTNRGTTKKCPTDGPR